MRRATNEAELRTQICLIGELMHRGGYIDGASGNISARLDENRVLTTPSGLAKGFMSPGEMIIVNLDGERVDEPTPENADLRPTSELVMHLECYRQRADIGGVVHAHPPAAVALTIAGYDFAQVLIPEVVLMLGLVPTLPYATPSSPESSEAIRRAIHEHDALLFAYHGSLTAAKHVWDAYLRLESLEHNAKIIHMAAQIGGPKGGLSPDQVRRLVSIRERLGLLRPGDAERFEQAAESVSDG